MKRFFNLINSRMLGACLIFAFAALLGVLLSPLTAFRLPGHNQGYSPTQPIAFSHALHAGQLGMDCQYCHFSAERGIHAQVPPVSLCLNCHRLVNPHHSPEIQKIYDALGLDKNLKPDPNKPLVPVAWTQIHVLPGFARFDHSRHVGAGVRCQTCHGEVEKMERVRQQESLSMGMCVGCHRRVNREGVEGRAVAASVDCANCHH